MKKSAYVLKLTVRDLQTFKRFCSSLPLAGKLPCPWFPRTPSCRQIAVPRMPLSCVSVTHLLQPCGQCLELLFIGEPNENELHATAVISILLSLEEWKKCAPRQGKIISNSIIPYAKGNFPLPNVRQP